MGEVFLFLATWMVITVCAVHLFKIKEPLANILCAFPLITFFGTFAFYGLYLIASTTLHIPGYKLLFWGTLAGIVYYILRKEKLMNSQN